MFDIPLRVAVIPDSNLPVTDSHMNAIRESLSPKDVLEVWTPGSIIDDAGFDMALVTGACGHTPLSTVLARTRIPSLCIDPHRGFHSFHSTFYDSLRRAGGIALPAYSPEHIGASVQAVRSRCALRTMKLIVADTGDNDFRNDHICRFAAACRERIGIDILIRSTDDIKQRTAAYDDRAADQELERWYSEILCGPGEMGPSHMRQIAKLYLAERDMLEESGAAGIAPADINGFLLLPQPEPMPNITYGPLLHDGYLVCEEADIEALATKLLLYAGLGVRGTMGNLYFAYRDRFGALATYGDYTPELELADCRQCFEDDHITICHFSTAGALPPEMMKEDRYTVREALPSWPGQGMICATPKLGPVAMARLGDDAARMHLVYGELDGVGFGEQYGWYRGRWFVRLPSVRDFAERCLHPHYTITPATASRMTLNILLGVLLDLQHPL